MFISGILLVSDSNFVWTKQVRQLISYFTEPVIYSAHFPISVHHFLTQGLQSRQTLLAENETLKRKNILLQRRLQQTASLMAENHRLRALLNSSESVKDKVLIAEVVGLDSDPFRHEIIINRGTHAQIKIGQTVLNEHGLIGQIIKVGPNTSRVLMISDSRHAVPIQVSRNGMRAMANGSGYLDKLILSHVPDTADIHVGDLLISSGLGGRFPAGYPVAEVDYIEHDPGQPFAKVEVKTHSSLANLHYVLVILKVNTFE